MATLSTTSCILIHHTRVNHISKEEGVVDTCEFSDYMFTQTYIGESSSFLQILPKSFTYFDKHSFALLSHPDFL